ncbi:protein MAINTENANCE OF MERISTEMS-like [Gossypium hirsutum]|uniref:Protein MAINTENANCE OF MERISTEMS-like n=1 Tax=Gossypium hirsutum TaxID=3635 RepID=A0ABM3AD75_GOSHI|nr:protein MAINTENANCE OF MERISTEMS-like [Gossypium hirsutum]
MASLISSKSHISDAVNNADSYRVLRGCVSILKNTPDARLMPYLELAGFGSVAQIRYTVLCFDLLSALVERWRPETHTFHFPCGECTLLGDSPGDGESYFSGVSFIWLKAKYGQLSATATEGELIVSSYSWGSAVLAVLYRELCRATDPKVRDIGGCLSLLQSWALYRMPFLASVEWSSGYRAVVQCPAIPPHD